MGFRHKVPKVRRHKGLKVRRHKAVADCAAIKYHKKTMKQLLIFLFSIFALCACDSTFDNPSNEKPPRPENALSTLTEDIEVKFDPNATLCYADCFGDYYRTGLDMWQFYVMEFNTKESLCIEVMVNPNDLTVPTGTFQATSDIYKAGGMLKGIIDEDNYQAYSWYIRLAKGDIPAANAPIGGGSVTITDNSDGTHTATFNLEDDAFNKIEGSYTGVFIVEDFRM